MSNKNYVYTRKINSTYYEVMDEVRFALSDEWFWIVSNIDVWQKIITKVTSDFGSYTILWVCNPKLAYRYLKIDLEYGVFMPCTVAVYEKEWSVHVSVWLPDVMINDIIKDPNLEKFLKEISETLKKVVDNI